jgi:DNA-directed RNA polymerase specialized sigma24 family protein
MLHLQTSSLPSYLDLDELAQRCCQESREHVARQACDEARGLELFQRAIVFQDGAAWCALYVEYRSLVAHWVRNHSKFPATGEDVAYFVNEAFARFWRTASRHQSRHLFEGLGQILNYLKVCAHSAIEDEWRRRRRYLPGALAWDDISEVVASGEPSPERHVMSRIAIEALAQAVLSHLRDEEDKVVAILSWTYGLRPQEIQARRPDLFPDVRRIYRVKRNLINRLQRDSVIQQLRTEHPSE